MLYYILYVSYLLTSSDYFGSYFVSELGLTDVVSWFIPDMKRYDVPTVRNSLNIF